MQKENEGLLSGETENKENNNKITEGSDTATGEASAITEESKPYSDSDKPEISNTEIGENFSESDFEELIKGPYKDAFTKKVQAIINKRFKETKQAEGKAANEGLSDRTVADEKTITSVGESTEASTYNALITAGVDPETAYRVLHLDEIMDSSMRYGAELAAKQLADSIRSKAARPHESALSGKGYSAKLTARSLTPEKRRELAKKALMGEHIKF